LCLLGSKENFGDFDVLLCHFIEKHADLGFSIACGGAKERNDYVIYVQYISDSSPAVDKLQ
jgi:hypothetical protein